MRYVLLVLMVVSFLNAEIEKKFYPSGELKSETSYNAEGKRNGIYKVYYKDGKSKEEIGYLNGRIEGMLKAYYESGKIWYEVPYKKGKKEGTVKTYHKNGKVKKEVVYEAGKAIRGYCYMTDGTKSEIEKVNINKLNK